MSVPWKQALAGNRDEIIACLADDQCKVLNGVLDQLEIEHCITIENKERVLHHFGPELRCTRLFELLLATDEHVFLTFCEALNQNGCGQLSRQLSRSLNPYSEKAAPTRRGFFHRIRFLLPLTNGWLQKMWNNKFRSSCNDSSPADAPDAANGNLIQQKHNSVMERSPAVNSSTHETIDDHYPKAPVTSVDNDDYVKCASDFTTDGTDTTELSTSPQINILLLGETGVGKSTWINGLANYYKFATFDDAEKEGPIVSIPTQFTIIDEKYITHNIAYGSDANEAVQVGQSATQMPHSYVFTTAQSDIRVCVIDTPGIGDTRGIEQDNKNMQHILTYISNYEQLHGIVILLKPNNARLSVEFRFCLKNLLAHLHKDACRNIVVCFTNAKSTFYRPGETLTALRVMLNEHKDIAINLSRDTMYCMDNESVRFLMAVKRGVDMTADQRAEVANSWKKAVDESRRLITYVSKLEPHHVKYTISLNEVRSSILALSRPIAEISSAIESNINIIAAQSFELLNADMEIDELKHKLFVPVVDLEVKHLQRPRTVCTAQKCIRLLTNNAETKTDYITVCCDTCNMVIETDQIGCNSLRQCPVMQAQSDSTDLTCKHCGCSWKVHMNITYETQQVCRKVPDANVQQLVDEAESKRRAIEAHSEELQHQLASLKNDREKMINTSATFAQFLKHNAVTPANDVLMEYIDHMVDVANGRQMAVEGLRCMRQRYEEQNQLISEAISGGSSNVTSLNVEDVHQLIVELKDLPKAGPMLHKVMNAAEIAANQAFQLTEDIVPVNEQIFLTN